jgi:hypothetical protein
MPLVPNMSRSPLRVALALLAAMVAAPLARAQTVYTWNDTGPDWATDTYWNPVGAKNWTTNGNMNIGLLPGLAVMNQPTVAAGSTVYGLGVSINTGGGANWNIGGGGTLGLEGSGTFTTGTPASARGLDIYGGGTATINVATQVRTSGQVWYTSGGSRTVVNSAVTGLVGTESLNMRAASDSSWQFNATAGAIGNVLLATTDGGSTARYEIGADNAFGIKILAVSGGSGGGIVLQAVGADRTLRNSSVNFTNYDIAFDGTQGLTLTGPVTFDVPNPPFSNRTLTSNIVGGSAIFSGGIAIRSTVGTDASSATTRTLTLLGGGRFDITGPITNGGSVGGVGQLNQLTVGSTSAAPTVRLSSATSDFNGNTQVLGGTLLIGATALSGSAGALGKSTFTVSVGALSGSQAASLLIDAGVNVGRSLNIRGANSGVSTIGGTTADATVFGGTVTIGSAVSLPSVPVIFDKIVQVTAAPGGSVVINNFTRVSGYTKDITINKVGLGDVRFGGGSTDLNAQLNVNAGTLALNGNFYAGRGVNVSAGTSLFANAGLTPGGSTNTLAVAGTLGGVGTINHPVIVSSAGTVAPGSPAAIGTLTVANQPVMLAAGSNFSVRLGPTATPTADALKVTGTGVLNITTNTNLLLQALGFAPLPSGAGAVSYPLGTVASLQVNSTNVVGDAPLGRYVAGTGNTGDLPIQIDPSLLTLNGGDQLLFDYTAGNLVLTYAPVPEPASILAVVAVAGLGLRAARRRGPKRLVSELEACGA